MSLDSTTWAALAFVLTALGVGYTYVAYTRRGLAAGANGLAWTLLPVALWLTGTLQLAGDIVDDVTRWAAHLVFSPAVWLGVVVAGISVVLFGTSATMRRRGIGTRGRTQKQRTVPASRTDQVGPASTRKAAPAIGSGDDDLADIEAILKKHGIR